MKEPYEFPIDFMLAIDEWDEWDHVRYKIEEYLRSLDILEKEEMLTERFSLPFIAYFEREIKRKLIKAGFKDNIFEDQTDFQITLQILDKQRKGVYGTWDHILSGYPANVVTFSEDRTIFWIKPDVEAALRALESITIIKRLLVNEKSVNFEAHRVYLRSLELVINLARMGTIPQMAKAEVAKQKNRKRTREMWSAIIYLAVKNVLETIPKPQNWTLGHVMLKFDKVNKGKILYGCATVSIGEKNSKRGIWIQSTRNSKSEFFGERSLHKYIDEYKRVQTNVTF